jgi:hypothetical protein
VEELTFEVVYFKGKYDALFGWPANTFDLDYEI